MKRVLVTGATGFLGAHVVRELNARGWMPIPTARAGTDRARLADVAGLRWVDLDLLSPISIQQAFAEVKPAAVIHSAAYGVDFRQQDPQVAIATNVTATALLLEAAANVGVKRFVHVGTCYEYGDKTGPILESDPLSPTTLYGATKAAGTLLALERSKTLGLPLVVVRPFGMYGPAEGAHKLVPLIKRACEVGEKLPLTSGEQIRDYIYVGDVVAALIELLEADSFPANEVFNLGSGRPVMIKEFVSECAKVFGDLTLMAFGALDYRPNEMWSVVSEPTKWERYFAQPVARTTLAEGLATLIGNDWEHVR